MQVEIVNCLEEQWQLPSMDPKCLAVEVMLQCIKDQAKLGDIDYSICDSVLQVPLEGPLLTIKDTKNQENHVILEDTILCPSLMDTVELLGKHRLLDGIDSQPSITAANRVRLTSMLCLIDEYIHDAVMFEWFYYPVNRQHVIGTLSHHLPLAKRMLYLYNNKLTDIVMADVKSKCLDDDLIFQQSQQQAYKKRMQYSTQELNSDSSASSTGNLKETRDKLSQILSTNFTMKVFRNVRKAYRSFNHLLEQSKTQYLFDTPNPTSLDCALYAYLAVSTQADYDCTPLKTILIFEYPRLLEFVEQFRYRHFDIYPSYVDSVWGHKRPFNAEPFLSRMSYSAVSSSVGQFLKDVKSSIFSQDDDDDESSDQRKDSAFDTEETRELQQFRRHRNIWLAGSSIAVTLYVYNRIIRPILEKMEY